MARALQRKVKSNGKDGKAAASRAAAAAANKVTAVVVTPRIQEMQDIMDLEKSKMETVRAAYATQNSQLAKANSSLMMKLSDLEKTLSELVQENVALRSRISMNELSYREKLNTQLQLLEEGMSHRLEEIFHMFDSIRRNENLSSAPASGHSREIRSILQRKRSKIHSYLPRLSNHIQFLNVPSGDEDGNPAQKEDRGFEGDNLELQSGGMNDLDRQNRKRRKSSRRDSIFLSTDFSFSDEDEKERESNTEISLEPAVPQLYESESIEKELQASSEDSQKQASASQDLQDEGSFSFSNSIIEYSIPEEMTSSIANNEEDAPSSSKIEVFRDDQHVLGAAKKVLGNDEGENNETMNKKNFIPIVPQNKVKHSMRPPNSRTGKKMIDEVMPNVSSSDIDFSKTRRTRGKAINYALPSLRAKMRRPSDKLVDATTTVSIHDLQVNKRSKRLRKSQPSNDDDSSEIQESLAAESLKTTSKIAVEEQPGTNKSAEGNTNGENSKMNGPTILKNTTAKPILRDITNKPHPKTFKPRKLYKNAVINDSMERDDDVSNNGADHSSSKNSRSQEDLSVFDLIGANNIKQANKTYRAKAKREKTSK